MTIQGKVQTSKTNDWGFTSYRVDGIWYGADAKGPARASEGETISFEAYDKMSKDGSRAFPTIKAASLKKVSAPASTPAATAGKPFTTPAAGGNRDTYWADKAKTDSDKDPRIAYFASSERAIQFVDLAMRNGAFVKDSAWEKVKQTDKLKVLTAFVEEQTLRIMAASYEAKVPTVKPETGDTEPSGSEEGEAVAETEEWS